MCYDISYRITLESIEDYFGNIVFEDPQLEIDFEAGFHVLGHAFSKQRVVTMEDGIFHGKRSEWGLIANYMNTPEKIKFQRAKMLNIRSERILGDKSSAWYRLRHQRCLVPVRGIFEHREIKGWKNKVPYHVWLKDRHMFCIPGLWNFSPIPDVETGQVRMTHAVITREANDIMKRIHNGGDNAFRMPLFLPKELELKWLDPTLDDEEMQRILDFEMPSKSLEYCPVYTIRTTKPHPNGGSKIDAFEWPNLPPLGNDEGQLQKAMF